MQKAGSGASQERYCPTISLTCSVHTLSFLPLLGTSRMELYPQSYCFSHFPSLAELVVCGLFLLLGLFRHAEKWEGS